MNEKTAEGVKLQIANEHQQHKRVISFGLFRDEDPTHVDKLKFYEFSGSVLGVNRVVDIDRIM